MALWALAAYPAQRFGGEEGLLYSSVAFALCLVPSVATLAWSGWAAKQSAEQQLLTVLVGTGVRMTVVLGVALALYTLVPLFGRSSFWFWVLIFYLFTLGLDTALLVAEYPRTGNVQETCRSQGSSRVVNEV